MLQTQKDVQQDGMIVSEGPEYSKQSEHPKN